MKTRIIALLLVMAAGIIIFSGCERENSEDVNQDRIYVYYELLYNGEQDITYARATFYFGGVTGTHLELTDPSYVTADGETMTWKPVLAYYEKSFAGVKDTITFEWQDTEGNIYINGVGLREIGLPNPIDTIQAGSSYELFWVGDALSENETVGAYINGPLTNDADPTWQTELGATSVIVSSDITLYFTPGENDVYLRRNYAPDIQQATEAGAEIHGVYRTPTEVVYVDSE